MAVLILMFVPLSPSSASSPVGCMAGRDLVVRYDQGGNTRYYNGRGPDCADWILVATRAGVITILVGSAIWVVGHARTSS